MTRFQLAILIVGVAGLLLLGVIVGLLLQDSEDGAAPTVDRTSLSSQTEISTRNEERKVDIDYLHTYLELYYNKFGYYPVEAEVNSGSWLSDPHEIDRDALLDPDGRLINSEGSDYVYLGINCGAEGCIQYELTTTLESAGTYSKSSLN